MVSRIEVALKTGVDDPTGSSVKRRILEDLKINSVSSVRTACAYTIEANLSEEEVKKVAQEIFTDAVTSHVSINAPCISEGFEFAVEVGFKPGVTDNVGGTAKEAIEDCLGKKISGGVYTSRIYFLHGKVKWEDVERIAREMLANELIERWNIMGSQGYAKAIAQIPKVHLAQNVQVQNISLELDDGKLIALSKSRLLALSLEEMKKIRTHFAEEKMRREREKQGLAGMPTDAELEMLAQTWSEHCKHKIFNAQIEYEENGKKETINSLFKTYVVATTKKAGKGKDWLLSVFSDNAGIIKFNNEWNLAIKVETHNTPSALDPYGGALTGILGVNRDVMGAGMGAKPIFNTDVLCFAPFEYAGMVPPKLLHPKRTLEGVRRGIERGGNASGIPTINGAVVFEPRFLGKPLVYCGTCGIMPAKINGKETHKKLAKKGDRIFMVGGRVGKDGIHGATFSSVGLDEASPTSAVQLGDAIVQKKAMDFLLEARDKGMYNAITDDGAGGLASSVGEMCQDTGGCVMHLERCPLKYPGLAPWEILVSESQERMTVAVPKEKAGEFAALAALYEVEATDLGEFTDSGYFVAKYKGKPVTMLEMEFLHKGVPQMKLEAKWEERWKEKESEHKMPQLGEALVRLLGRPNICSKEYIVRQYDHEVMGMSVLKPLCGEKNDGPSDAGIIAPVEGSEEGVAISNGICPRYSDVDAYWMAANAIDEAVRNLVASGVDVESIAGLDNFCWCDPIYTKENPDGKYRLAQLVRANRALFEVCTEYGIPLISGKDSMKNDYKHGNIAISIPPTLLFSAIGKVKDRKKTVSSDFKEEGDVVYVLGKTYNECAKSEYFEEYEIKGGRVPKVNAKENLKLYKCLAGAIEKGIVRSAHDCSDGGLGVAIAECCIGGRVGVRVDLEKVPCESNLADDRILFSESSGRFVVSVKEKDCAKFEKEMKGCEIGKIGNVRKDEAFEVKETGEQGAIYTKVSVLVSAWQKTMKW
ncbi:Phosphoribosylformylglycinamidine synthase subunit PurL [Candidatus Anstonella stagnisolia]|nr:Phosphoribosylformylglycinamidine synthase subunit PurL [Candidatus Anstonella stagnisolia]